MRTNYRKNVQAGRGYMNIAQIRRVAAAGSFVTIKGGSLWTSAQD